MKKLMLVILSLMAFSAFAEEKVCGHVTQLWTKPNEEVLYIKILTNAGEKNFRVNPPLQSLAIHFAGLAFQDDGLTLCGSLRDRSDMLSSLSLRK